MGTEPEEAHGRTPPAAGAIAPKEDHRAPPVVDELGPLVRAAQAGDPAALERLVVAVGPAVTRAVRGVLGGRPEAEDVVQEALWAFYEALPAFRGESRIQSYAAGIAVRHALSARAKHGRRQRLGPRASLDHDPAATSADDSWFHGSMGGGPEEEALARALREALRGLLERLPDAQAEALALRILLGYSIEEIAEATGAPLNTVRGRLATARRTLLELCERRPELGVALGRAP